MNHLTEEQLVAHYYADADQAPEIGQHLSQCESCRAGFQELQQVLKLVSDVPIPERSEGYGQEVWQRLQPHLNRRRRFWAFFTFRPPRWAMAASLGALLIAAFLLGRFWPRPEPAIVLQTPAAAVRERVLLASVSEHLERSQILLTELAHSDEDREIDISPEQEKVRELLVENRILRQSAARDSEPGVADILGELERFLLELEHSPSRLSAPELAQFRERITTAGILFRIRIVESHLREQQKAGARDLARRTL